MSYTWSVITFFFQKRNALFLCVIIITTEKWWIIRTSFLCVFFFFRKRLPQNFIGLIRPVSSASMYVDWASMYVDWEKNALHEFEYVYIINVALIMLIQKGHFTHTFKVAICFSSWNRFDPLPHSSGSDITPFLSPYLTLPCPESWFPIALPLSLQQHTHTYIIYTLIPSTVEVHRRFRYKAS